MRSILKKGIRDNKSLHDLRAEIVNFKNGGGSQQEARRILSELRSEFRSKADKEDRVLELLDLVSGWCNPSLLIWDEEL